MCFSAIPPDTGEDKEKDNRKARVRQVQEVVEETMDSNCTEQPCSDYRDLFAGRPEFGYAEGKAPEYREQRVAGNREYCPERPADNQRGEGLHGENVEKVLQRGKSQRGRRGIDDPVHGFVEFGVPVDEQDDHGEFRQLFRHRDGENGEQDIGYERDNNVFKEKCDDCGNHAQKIHFRNKGEGFGFVAVLLVEEPEPEEAGRQGNDKDEPAVHSGEWAMIPY